MGTDIVSIAPGTFSSEAHFYSRVPNAVMHPLVRMFLNLGNDRIATRYCHLHPEVDPVVVRELLASRTKVLRWAGADLFHVTDESGVRQNVVIETNSSPSGQKSMPLMSDDSDEAGGYRRLLAGTFVPMLRRRGLPAGRLAVLYDKNRMEASGYAHILADLTGEEVLLAYCAHTDPDALRTVNGVLQLRTDDGWQPLRGAVRYLTQRPWNRVPPLVRTALMNPVLACLAGGRNKLIAAKAYDFYNADMTDSGLRIRFPETIWDVPRPEVPLWIERMGGVAVVKNPYSNAGQGVWTITRPEELDAFMELEHDYERFVVQGLVGNIGWTSQNRGRRLYHVGTVPDRQGNIYVADLRFMVGMSPEGPYPVAMYARRTRTPLAPSLDGAPDSWSMLGTNLSVRLPDGTFDPAPSRLMLMDSRDFNRLGLGLDDLTEGYLQTVMAMHAIDRMAQRLTSTKGRFRRKLFGSLVPDPSLLEEIVRDDREA